MEEKKIFNALTVYRERGIYLQKLEQYEKALAAFNEAFKSDETNESLLLARSQVYANVGHPEQAFENAEMALKVQPDNMLSRSVQARALYAMTDFEKSVVMGYRGFRRRRQPPYFKDCINQGIETIQDCIGAKAGQLLLENRSLISDHEALHGDLFEPVVEKHFSRIPQPEVKQRLTQYETRKNKILSNVLAMKYLGPMAYDKFFLQELVKDRRLISANSAASRELKNIAEKALRALCDRQDMLRTQRPYLAMKRAEKSESKYLSKYRKQTLLKERQVSTRNAERFLNEVKTCLHEFRIMDQMAKAERMQIFLDTKTPHTLPTKDHYISSLYKLVGEGYLCQYRLSYKLSEKGNRDRIGFLLGVLRERPKSFDSVIANYPYKFRKTADAILKTKADLDICENGYMKCFLLFEMARLYILAKNYAYGKYYSKQCQREAQKIESVTWWLNGCFTLMSGDMQQGNQVDVLNQIEEAYRWTVSSPNPEITRAFLYRCARVASETIISDDQVAVVEREQQILKVVDKETREEAKVFFKRMSVIPAGRRFMVLPQQRKKVATTERTKLHQHGLTVVLGKEKSLRASPKSTVPGFQNFDE